MCQGSAVSSRTDLYQCCVWLDLGHLPFSNARSNWPVKPAIRYISRLTVVQSIVNSHFVPPADKAAAYRATLHIYAGAEHMLPLSFNVGEGGIR